MKTSIALIGFMGVGKSTLAKNLAVRLGKKLVEVDSLISAKAGKTIQDIFHDEGEIAFREMEISVIKEISSGQNLVIDCGGGVALNKINLDRLKQNAVIVWLTASPEVILNRTIMLEDQRPLLQGKNKVSEILQMMRSREFYYQSAADVTIDTSKGDTFSLTEEIIDKVMINADYTSSK
jgi:shikimate kinase